jgi:hypothetical protein
MAILLSHDVTASADCTATDMDRTENTVSNNSSIDDDEKFFLE